MSMELIVMDKKSFTKYWNFEIVHETQTSSKSVKRLARHLAGNKSTYDSANYHKSPPLLWKWVAIFLVRSLFWVYPTDIAGVTFGELFRG